MYQVCGYHRVSFVANRFMPFMPLFDTKTSRVKSIGVGLQGCETKPRPNYAIPSFLGDSDLERRIISNFSQCNLNIPDVVKVLP